MFWKWEIQKHWSMGFCTFICKFVLFYFHGWKGRNKAFHSLLKNEITSNFARNFRNLSRNLSRIDRILSQQAWLSLQFFLYWPFIIVIMCFWIFKDKPTFSPTGNKLSSTMIMYIQNCIKFPCQYYFFGMKA